MSVVFVRRSSWFVVRTTCPLPARASPGSVAQARAASRLRRSRIRAACAADRCGAVPQRASARRTARSFLLRRRVRATTRTQWVLRTRLPLRPEATRRRCDPCQRAAQLSAAQLVRLLTARSAGAAHSQRTTRVVGSCRADVQGAQGAARRSRKPREPSARSFREQRRRRGACEARRCEATATRACTDGAVALRVQRA